MAKITAAGLDQPVLNPRGAGDVVASPRRSAAVAATLAQNDLVVLGILPAWCELVDFALDATDLDTNASPAIVLAVGILNAAGDDLNANQNIITASTVAQAGGVQFANDPKGLALAAASVDRYLVAKVITAAGTGAAGTLGGRVYCVAKN